MKYIVFLLIFLFVSLQAQQEQFPTVETPLSFRSSALGGVVSDDLDLIFDPVELRFVDRIRLYTNLSNLTSGEEELLNDRSDNEFLFGASWQNWTVFDWWTSVLLRYRNAQSANPLQIDQDLNGIPDVGADGDFSAVYTSLIDSNQDGVFDIRREIDQSKSSFDRARRRILIINNTFLVEGTTLGLRFSHASEDARGNTAGGFYGSASGPLLGASPGDASFEVLSEVFDLTGSGRVFLQDESGSFLADEQTRSIAAQLTLMRLLGLGGLGTTEARIDIAYLREETATRRDDTYRGSYETYNTGIAGYLDQFSEGNETQTKNSYEGNGVLLSAGLHKVFQQADSRRDDGFVDLSFGWKRLGMDYLSNQRLRLQFADIQFDGSDTLTTDFRSEVTNNFVQEDNGTASWNEFRAAIRANGHVGKRVYGGIGVGLSYGKFLQNSAYDETTTNSRLFVLQDTLTSNDLTSTTTQFTAADRKLENRQLHLQVPVGIEYSLTESGKWALRLGSRFEVIERDAQESFQVNSVEPRTVITRYTDGRVETQVFSNDFNSTSQRQETIETRTSFYYGLGYQPTEHLQLDLLGFLGDDNSLGLFDSAFLRRLRISVAIRL